jgi:hypothetical protein
MRPSACPHRFALDDAAGLAGFLVERLGLAAPPT